MINKFPAFYRTWTCITYWQESTTELYPKPDKSTPHSHILFKNNFNTIFPSMPGSLRRSFLFRFWPSGWRWRQHGPPKCWHPTATLHSVTTQKTLSWNSTFYTDLVQLWVCHLVWIKSRS